MLPLVSSSWTREEQEQEQEQEQERIEQEQERKRIEQEQRIQQSELLPVELDVGQPAPLQLQIRALESVGMLRRRAAEELGLPEERLQLMFVEHALLEMGATLESAGIRPVSWRAAGRARRLIE